MCTKCSYRNQHIFFNEKIGQKQALPFKDMAVKVATFFLKKFLFVSNDFKIYTRIYDVMVNVNIDQCLLHIFPRFSVDHNFSSKNCV